MTDLDNKNINTLREKIRKWIDIISVNEKIPEDIKAIYIGLFNGAETKTYQIYFSASKTYDPADDDWACNQDFEPVLKYLDSGVSTLQDWQLFQDEVVEGIKAVLLTDSTILNQVEHVGVGFDSGDLVHIR